MSTAPSMHSGWSSRGDRERQRRDEEDQDEEGRNHQQTAESGDIQPRAGEDEQRQVVKRRFRERGHARQALGIPNTNMTAARTR